MPSGRWLAVLLAAALAAMADRAGATPSIYDAIDRVQPAMVKIYGAGGLRGLEAYQSGMLISGEGHILTVFSYVLDTDAISVTLADGRKFEARLLGADPRLELAVLKIDAKDLPHFDLRRAVEVEPGARVLAFSNLFGVATGNEPASVQHGIVSIKTRLDARRGVFKTTYNGPVYVVDAVTNNPGAAGGALVTQRGELVAMLGKELRNAGNNTWLNYAVPIAELGRSVEEIRSGKSFRALHPEAGPDQPAETNPARASSAALLGIVLVPDVVGWTPPYVDDVRQGSPAAAAGVRPDDLVVMVGDRLVRSVKALDQALETIDRDDPVKLTVLRGQELLEFVLKAPDRQPSGLP